MLLPLRAIRRWFHPVALMLVCATDSAFAAESSGDIALRERIRAMVEDLDDVPLPLIVEALSGFEVLPWDGQAREALENAALLVRVSVNREGIASPRINEAGNVVEKHVVAALREAGFTSGRPVAPSGRARAAGYPDLEASFDGLHFYVEVKVFSEGTRDSTQRTFYLSPSADFKVARNAHHLLIAVELTESAPGVYRARTVRWLDLARLRCDLKYEFNANNRDLYEPAAGLIIMESSDREK